MGHASALKTHLSPRDLALALAVVAVWGYTFVPIKVAFAEAPPFALAAMRFFLAAVPMVFFIRRPTMPWRSIAAYGIAIGVFQYSLLFLGMKLGMPAVLSSIVMQVQVFFTMGLAVAFAGGRLQPGARCYQRRRPEHHVVVSHRPGALRDLAGTRGRRIGRSNAVWERVRHAIRVARLQ